MEITEEEKLKNVEKTMKLVEQLPEPRRSQVKSMLEGWVGEIYFTCPASSRADFHSSYPGGLCAHSLNVVANLYQLAKTLCPGEFKNETLIFVGLFHDLGKVGDGVRENYVPNSNPGGRNRGSSMRSTRNASMLHRPSGGSTSCSPTGSGLTSTNGRPSA